jgi:hypothetical protein
MHGTMYAVYAIAIAFTPKYIQQTLMDVPNVSISHRSAPIARSAAVHDLFLQVNVDSNTIQIGVVNLESWELVYMRICT